VLTEASGGGRPIYAAIGVNLTGEKDILGLHAAQAAPKAATAVHLPSKPTGATHQSVSGDVTAAPS
jgi:hypothetical protein